MFKNSIVVVLALVCLVSAARAEDQMVSIVEPPEISGDYSQQLTLELTEATAYVLQEHGQLSPAMVKQWHRSMRLAVISREPQHLQVLVAVATLWQADTKQRNPLAVRYARRKQIGQVSAEKLQMAYAQVLFEQGLGDNGKDDGGRVWAIMNGRSTDAN